MNVQANTVSLTNCSIGDILGPVAVNGQASLNMLFLDVSLVHIHIFI